MALNYFKLKSNFLPFVLRHPLYRSVNSHHRTNLQFHHFLTVSSTFIRPLSLSSSLKLFSSPPYAKGSTPQDTDNDLSKGSVNAAQKTSKRVGNTGTFVTPDIIQKLHKGEEKRVKEWRERNELLKQRVIPQKQETPSSSTPSKSESSQSQTTEVKKKRKLINRIFNIPDNESWRTPKHAWKIGMTFILLASSINFVVFVLVQGQDPVDEKGEPVTDEYSEMPPIIRNVARAFKAAWAFQKSIAEPSRKTLLPPPLKEPYFQPPYTLVIELKDLLIRPEWNANKGWQWKKRPGIDYLLEQCSPPIFEIVTFTEEGAFTLWPFIDALDKQGYISYRLFRDSTRYEHGVHFKDIRCLGRELPRVVSVDVDSKVYKFTPSNAIILPKWDGDVNDRTLFDLADFLRMIGTSGVEDIRPVLEYYRSQGNPLEVFREKQQLLLEEQKQQLEGAAAQGTHRAPALMPSGLKQFGSFRR